MQCYSDNLARLQHLADAKAPYLFSSNNLLVLLDSVLSVKTRLSIVSLIGPRLIDPSAKFNEIIDVFRFAEEKAKVEGILKQRSKVLSASLFNKSRGSLGGNSSRTSTGGRGNSSTSGRVRASSSCPKFSSIDASEDQSIPNDDGTLRSSALSNSSPSLPSHELNDEKLSISETHNESAAEYSGPSDTRVGNTDDNLIESYENVEFSEKEEKELTFISKVNVPDIIVNTKDVTSNHDESMNATASKSKNITRDQTEVKDIPAASNGKTEIHVSKPTSQMKSQTSSSNGSTAHDLKTPVAKSVKQTKDGCGCILS